MTHLRLFTSESVTEGHPDKICDQISDRILDAYLAADPASRVAVETVVTTGQVHVVGEVRSSASVDTTAIIRKAISDIGYTAEMGFGADHVGVLLSVGAQSPEIAAGVDTALETREEGSEDPYDQQGAGDQGIMFGFASDETPSLMPAPIHLAHALAQRLSAVRKSGELAYLRPDGKTQATVGYDGNVPKTVDTVVVSTQHDAGVDHETLQRDIIAHVVAPVLAELDLDSTGYTAIINPAGPFVIGGPQGDAGLTGRKIIVDTYGGFSRHGGGAFSGKDPSKVDRSAAYALRWVAKNAVAAGLARKLEVQIAYAIGQARPVGLYVESFGTGAISDDAIIDAINTVFDLRPLAIINDLDLIRPIYSETATYGHFGRDQFSWEKLDRVDALRAAAGL